MKHFITTADWSRPELEAMLAMAERYRDAGRGPGAGPDGDSLKGRAVALLFFNPSMRTRSSFEIGVWQLGGHAVVLQPGRDAWGIEFAPGTVMDGEAEEHVSEVARVLSRYCDLIAVRAFPKFVDWSVDRRDAVIRAVAEHADVPVINMETITHPCQELALMMAIRQRVGRPDGKRFLLTWTYHPKPLNTAVANSALIIAAKFGMHVTLLCPTDEYILDERYMAQAAADAREQGGSLTVSHDPAQAYAGAHVVYAKSWGALPYFGRWEDERPIREAHRHYIVDEQKMALTDDAVFSHCLPLRRNVKATDAVMDADYCMAIDEAENRLHVQKAVMTTLVRG